MATKYGARIKLNVKVTGLGLLVEKIDKIREAVPMTISETTKNLMDVFNAAVADGEARIASYNAPQPTGALGIMVQKRQQPGISWEPIRFEIPPGMPDDSFPLRIQSDYVVITPASDFDNSEDREPGKNKHEWIPAKDFCHDKTYYHPDAYPFTPLEVSPEIIIKPDDIISIK